MKETLKKVYVTDDGKEFFDRKDASEHEQLLNAREALKDYEFNGPDFTPGDEMRLMGYNWHWYRVESQEDFDAVREALLRCPKGVRSAKFWFRQDVYSGDFPEYLCYSPVGGELHRLSDLVKEHERAEEKWKKFYEPFREDMDKEREDKEAD